jgi:T5SS/PEP-CTERM-associated repeat protein
MATSSLWLTDGVPRCPSRTTPACAGAGFEQVPRRPGTLPYYEKAFRYRPDNPQYAGAYAFGELFTNNFTEAERGFAAALQLNHDLAAHDPRARGDLAIVVDGLSTGTLTIQNGGTMNSGGGSSVGLSASSFGTVMVTGPGSSWNNSPGGGFNIGRLARAHSRSRSVGWSSLTPPPRQNRRWCKLAGYGDGDRRGLHLEQQFGEYCQVGHGHAHNRGQRHCHRAFCDRDERRGDWNTQHRRGPGQSDGSCRSCSASFGSSSASIVRLFRLPRGLPLPRRLPPRPTPVAFLARGDTRISSLF